MQEVIWSTWQFSRRFVRTVLCDIFFSWTGSDVLSGRRFVRTAFEVFSGYAPFCSLLPFFAAFCSFLLIFVSFCPLWSCSLVFAHFWSLLQFFALLALLGTIWTILGTTWALLGQYLGNTWAILERYLGNNLASLEQYLDNNWSQLGRYFGNTWVLLGYWLNNSWALLREYFGTTLAIVWHYLGTTGATPVALIALMNKGLNCNTIWDTHWVAVVLLLVCFATRKSCACYLMVIVVLWNQQ